MPVAFSACTFVARLLDPSLPDMTIIAHHIQQGDVQKSD